MKPLRIVGLALATAAAPVCADVVIDWNSELLNAVRITSRPPPVASRQMAIVHLAIYDAINGVTPTHRHYLVPPQAPAGASADASACAAAKAVLDSLYAGDTPPSFSTARAAFAARYASLLAAIPDGQAKTDGLAWGASVGNDYLTSRANDGSTTIVPYTQPATPGVWRPTLPANAGALLPGWGQVTPFALVSGSDVRPQPPPKLDSSAYALEVTLTRDYGGTTSSLRTADQTEIALFWADGGGTETPPGHWMHIAQTVSAAQGLSSAQNARLFALLGICVADAAIVAWDAKYAYNYWRPITAIREADTDGNAATSPDPTWLPLIATPPFPEYTSGHSTFSRAAATALSGFLGSDNIPFTTSSDGLVGVTRNYTSFSAAADEAGVSRIYGGIHFASANIAGQTSAYQLATFALDHFLTSQSDLQFSVVNKSAGGCALTLQVTPGQTYRLEASSNLATWEQLAVVTSNTNIVNFTDVNAPPGKRFYRAVPQ